MNVLFVGSTNSGRSVLAEHLFLSQAGDRHHASSAGNKPAAAVEPTVAEALAELGVDARDHVPHLLNDDEIAVADIVVLTCDDGCLISPGKPSVTWDLPNTHDEPIERVREIRDEIRARVERLAAELDGQGAEAAAAARY